MSVPLLQWDAPGPYVVAFTMRNGGVSTGKFESLNLGRRSLDDPANVAENRRRACGAIGADLARLTMNFQRHSATVNRAHAGRFGEPGDGLWTSEPDVPMLKLTADCVPIAIARRDPRARSAALALLHAGWRGLLEGVVAAGAAALGDDDRAAVVGPAIGPCCYEVGAEVAEPFAARYGRDVLRGRNLDLWTVAERALRDAGVTRVERLDICTACHPDLFFSYRRDGAKTGAQGVIGYVSS